MAARRKLLVKGVVQGVGFRPFVYKLARSLGLSGWTRNTSHGVEIEVEGAPESLDDFMLRVRSDAPALARIDSIASEDAAPVGETGFAILESLRTESTEARIPADVATCSECFEEISRRGARRENYPFTNCTNCGPRFTIIRQVPYERTNTTMGPFEMCPDCAAEYADPGDRRFHAEPIACPVCGPKVWLVPGEAIDEKPPRPSTELRTLDVCEEKEYDALQEAGRMLADGRILAIKGLGGFHLACDARNDDAVRLLRERKGRAAKPFALMVKDLAEAEKLCDLTDLDRSTLQSYERPITLVRRRPDSDISGCVAPGNRMLGIMLPYTPLHLLLFEHSPPALVMTSGNLSEEPIAFTNESAQDKLSRMADAFLLHDRDIQAPCDDSVVRSVALPPLNPLLLKEGRNKNPLLLKEGRTGSSPILRGGQRATSPLEKEGHHDDTSPLEKEGHHDDTSPLEKGGQRGVVIPIRRARGFVPDAIHLPIEVPDILACGAEQKNTFCLAWDSTAVLSQHIGDLDTVETLDYYQYAIEHFKSLCRRDPKVIAHDLHPGYMSTRYALEQTEARLVGVQHHHAHIASCLAENRRTEKCIGVSLDGTGYGTDGTVWGGEILAADLAGFERAAHFAQVRLPGGEAAVRDPRRIAAAYLYAVYGEQFVGKMDELGFGFTQLESAAVRRQLETGLNSPVTSSAGRLFDAISAAVGICRERSYEGQPAIELEMAACEEEGGVYDAGMDSANGVLVLDTLALFRAAVEERLGGVDPVVISARFHNSIVRLVCSACETIRERTGLELAALSGGVFQNALVLSGLMSALEESGFEVLVHSKVPPNDGGLSLGQAAVAACHPITDSRSTTRIRRP